MKEMLMMRSLAFDKKILRMARDRSTRKRNKKLGKFDGKWYTDRCLRSSAHKSTFCWLLLLLLFFIPHQCFPLLKYITHILRHCFFWLVIYCCLFSSTFLPVSFSPRFLTWICFLSVCSFPLFFLSLAHRIFLQSLAEEFSFGVGNMYLSSYSET